MDYEDELTEHWEEIVGNVEGIFILRHIYNYVIPMSKSYLQIKLLNNYLEIRKLQDKVQISESTTASASGMVL